MSVLSSLFHSLNTIMTSLGDSLSAESSDDYLAIPHTSAAPLCFTSSSPQSTYRRYKMKTLTTLIHVVLNIALLLASKTVCVLSIHPTNALLWRIATIKSRSILNIGFNSILLLALMLGTGAVSSVTALGNVAPVAAVNSLVTCSSLTFAAPTNYTVENGPIDIAVGDFDGNGEEDLATTQGTSGGVSIFLGNGTGSFSTATRFTSADAATFGIVVVDVNSDSKQDLVTTGGFAEVGGALLIFLGDGTGSFGFPSVYQAGSFLYDVAVGDFNGDGQKDLAFPSASAGSFSYSAVGIYLADGAGDFIRPPTYFPLIEEAYPGSLAVGDFNGDGNQDLATGNGNINASISILLGDGMGTFGTPTYFSTGYAANVTVGDFNNDGKQDLATTDTNPSSNTVSILLGNGTGTFGTPTKFTVGTYPYFASVSDFNSDGNEDLAVVNRGSNNVSILLGNGTGTFGAAMNLTIGGTDPISLAVGDFNGDGRRDLAVTSFGSRVVSIFLNTCQAIPADLSITKSDTPDPVTPGGTLTYSLDVTNNGSGDATNVIVTDTLPLGVTFDPATSSPGCAELGGVVTCDLGDLANGASATVTIVVTVDASTACGTTLSSIAEAMGNEPDPILPNTVSADTMITCPVELNIRPEASPNRIRLNGSTRLVHVTILSNSSFDAPNAVDRSSLTFGHSGNENSLHRQGRDCWRNDVNRDSLLDLICNFVIRRTGFQPADTVGILKGMLLDGTSFEAQDSVIIMVSGNDANLLMLK
jgi:uncharacterized repeat protein (TIGR01451 family)